MSFDAYHDLKEDIKELKEIMQKRDERLDAIAESVAFMRGQMEGSGFRAGAPITSTTPDASAITTSILSKQNGIMVGLSVIVSAIVGAVANALSGAK